MIILFLLLAFLEIIEHSITYWKQNLISSESKLWILRENFSVDILMIEVLLIHIICNRLIETTILYTLW